MVTITDLSFMRAHGNSANMIRYNGLHYGYYAYFYLSRTGKIGNGVPPITKEQAVEEIKIHQVTTNGMVRDCFPGMTTDEIQKICLERFEKFESTNYTTNDDYNFTDALKFCHEHRLHEELKYIVNNYPDRAEVKKYLGNKYFMFWTPMADYIREGNLDMVKFFYEQGADFSDSDFYLIKCAAKENKPKIVKYLLPKYKKQMSLETYENCFAKEQKEKRLAKEEQERKFWEKKEQKIIKGIQNNSISILNGTFTKEHRKTLIKAGNWWLKYKDVYPSIAPAGHLTPYGSCQMKNNERCEGFSTYLYDNHGGADVYPCCHACWSNIEDETVESWFRFKS